MDERVINPIDMPAWPIETLADVLQLPMSTLEELIQRGEGPEGLFLLGRRRYILKEDAFAWLKSQKAMRPYVKRRNNTR